MKRVQTGIHPAMASTLVAGAMLAAVAGAMLAPAPAETAQAHPASTNAPVVHTIAHSTPLSTPVRQSSDGGDACVSGADDGTQVCVLPVKPKTPSSVSSGTPKSQQASTGSPGSSESEETDPIKVLTSWIHDGAGAVSSVASAVGDVAKAATAWAPLAAMLGAAV
ncbi:hypothetical protein [Pseudonocardia acaciae]|uniref:hypothetical protein n=1 Tax=Pseudonocardia acaciae TaxID=551276 RepID=UPI0012EDB26E|nr:hypothetical protein [Pseudonocardia acaciae]